MSAVETQSIVETKSQSSEITDSKMEIEASSHIEEESKENPKNVEAENFHENSEPSGLENKPSDSESESDKEEKMEKPNESSNLKDSEAESEPED